MSFLGKLFGKKEDKASASASMSPVVPPAGGSRGGGGGASKTPDVFSKIQQLEERKRLNDKRVEELDRQIDTDIQEAKRYLEKGDKARAALVMKRKKLKETERQNKLNFMFTLESQISELQQALGQAEDAKTQIAFAEGMKEVTRAVDPEKVIQMQEEMEEARDKMREVQDVLYTPIMTETDAEVEAELAELQADITAEKMAGLNLPGAVSQPMPKLPAQPAKAESVDDELAALEREMGLTA